MVTQLERMPLTDRTFAAEFIYAIHTHLVLCTCRINAILNVNVAQISGEPQSAGAREVTWRWVGVAGSSVSTGSERTCVIHLQKQIYVYHTNLSPLEFIVRSNIVHSSLIIFSHSFYNAERRIFWNTSLLNSAMWSPWKIANLSGQQTIVTIYHLWMVGLPVHSFCPSSQRHIRSSNHRWDPHRLQSCYMGLDRSHQCWLHNSRLQHCEVKNGWKPTTTILRQLFFPLDFQFQK